jgi:hypothetical protein
MYKCVHVYFDKGTVCYYLFLEKLAFKGTNKTQDVHKCSLRFAYISTRVSAAKSLAALPGSLLSIMDLATITNDAPALSASPASPP